MAYSQFYRTIAWRSTEVIEIVLERKKGKCTVGEMTIMHLPIETYKDRGARPSEIAAWRIRKIKRNQEADALRARIVYD